MSLLLEKTNVRDVYDEIATHFSDTRYCIWNFVKIFLENQNKEFLGLDIGCGNGKNMLAVKDLNILGIDSCKQFVNICNNKGLKVFHGDCCDICFIDNTFDYAISIAVYHHMASNERRINAIGEMIRILKKGGKGLFSVWSVENQENEKKKRNFKPGKNMVSWCRNTDKKIFNRFYYIFTSNMIKSLLDNFNNEIIIDNLYNERGNWVVEFTKL